MRDMSMFRIGLNFFLTGMRLAACWTGVKILTGTGGGILGATRARSTMAIRKARSLRNYKYRLVLPMSSS